MQFTILFTNSTRSTIFSKVSPTQNSSPRVCVCVYGVRYAWWYTRFGIRNDGFGFWCRLLANTDIVTAAHQNDTHRINLVAVFVATCGFCHTSARRRHTSPHLLLRARHTHTPTEQKLFYNYVEHTHMPRNPIQQLTSYANFGITQPQSVRSMHFGRQPNNH